MIKDLPANSRGTGAMGSTPGRGPLEEEMAAHSSVLGWKTLWTEEPGSLQSTGSQTVEHH